MTQTIYEEKTVKSRHRVKTYGEVFTPHHMVEQVLDLVSEDLEAGPDPHPGSSFSGRSSSRG